MRNKTRLFGPAQRFGLRGIGPMNTRETAQQSRSGELWRAFPPGNGVGSVDMRRGSSVGGMVLTQGFVNCVEGRSLLLQRGAFPVEAEALTADAALDILFDVGLSNQNLHDN